MKNLTVTPQSLSESVTVAERIAFLHGQEESLRLDHDTLHQLIVDVRVALDSPSAVLLDMVGLQSAVFVVESEIRDAREGIRSSLVQAYMDAGAQYAYLYAKEILGTPAATPLKLSSKRSGKHKASTEEAVKNIMGSDWWQEYAEQERSSLTERSRAKAGIKDIAEAHANAASLHNAKATQYDSLRTMESALEAQMRETSVELSKWLAVEAVGLSEVVLPPLLEKAAVDTPRYELWCDNGISNVYVWSQDDRNLYPVTDLVPVQGNERDGIRFVTKEGNYAWSVRYANYRRTASYPRAELVVAPSTIPTGATVVSTANLVSVMDTSG